MRSVIRSSPGRLVCVDSIFQFLTILTFQCQSKFSLWCGTSYLFAIEFHFQFRHPRPLHAPDSLCGFCHSVFCRLQNSLWTFPLHQ